jgi:hypothetical protein
VLAARVFASRPHLIVAVGHAPFYDRSFTLDGMCEGPSYGGRHGEVCVIGIMAEHGRAAYYSLSQSARVGLTYAFVAAARMAHALRRPRPTRVLWQFTAPARRRGAGQAHRSAICHCRATRVWGNRGCALDIADGGVPPAITSGNRSCSFARC